MKQKPTLTLTGLILAVALTGCNALPGNNQGQPATPDAVTTPAVTPSTTVTTETPVVVVTPEPTTAEPTPTVSAEEIVLRIREGTYLDAWAQNIATYFQRQANVHRHENENTLSPGDLQTFLDGIIATETPYPFIVTATTTAFNNFTIKVSHPIGYKYTDEDNAYTVESDPQIVPTPTPSETPSSVERGIDELTKELLYKAGLAVRSYAEGNMGQMPTDDYMRTEGYIPNGWDWSVSQDEFEPDYYTLHVWNGTGYLYNSEGTAARYTSYPQAEMRPSYNFDVDEFVPIVGFTDPNMTAPPNPSPAPETSPSPPPIVSTPLPDPITNDPTPMPEPTGEPAS